MNSIFSVMAAETNAFQETILYILIPMTAIIAGGILAIFISPGPIVRSAVQHFAAGVVFYAVAVELLPKVVAEKEPLVIAIGFIAGVVAMLAMKKFTEGGAEGEKGEPEKPTSLFITVAVDVTIDGLLVGLGFAAGAREGTLLTIALGIEILFLGLATSTALTKAGVKPGKIIGLHSGLAALILTGGILGSSLLGGMSGWGLELFLSFGVAALLYLITEELLVKAHSELDTPIATAMFFAGFLLFLMIGMIA